MGKRSGGVLLQTIFARQPNLPPAPVSLSGGLSRFLIALPGGDGGEGEVTKHFLWHIESF